MGTMKNLKGAQRVMLLAITKHSAAGKAEQDSDNGWLEGYLAVFGNVDGENERIRKGAFQQSILERVPAGKVPLMIKHFRDGGDVLNQVGLVTEAKEDDFGLWIHADFLDDEQSQTIRAKVVAGAVKGLSVGFVVLEYIVDKSDPDHYIYDLTIMRLLEATITLMPVNELATITDAKDFTNQAATQQSFNQALQQLTASTQAMKDICDKLNVKPSVVTSDSDPNAGAKHGAPQSVVQGKEADQHLLEFDAWLVEAEQEAAQRACVVVLAQHTL